MQSPSQQASLSSSTCLKVGADCPRHDLRIQHTQKPMSLAIISTRPTVQPMHDRTLHGGSTRISEVFFVRYNGAPSKNRQTQEKQNKENTITPKKQKKYLKNKPKNKKHIEKHCMFDSKCCCAWPSLSLGSDFRCLIGPGHFQPPGSTIKVEKFQMKHMRISRTLSQDIQRKHN